MSFVLKKYASVLVFIIIVSFFLYSCTGTGILDGSSSSSNSSSSSSNSTSTNFGIYTETVPQNAIWDVDCGIESFIGLWGVLINTNSSTDPGDGSICIQVDGTNLAMGFLIKKKPNETSMDLSECQYLHFMYKGSTLFDLMITCDGSQYSITGTTLTNFGLATNNSWCKVRIPLTEFGNPDLSQVEEYFRVSAIPTDGHIQDNIYYFDNIYYSGSNYSYTAPSSLSNSAEQFSLYSETHGLDVEWNANIQMKVFSDSGGAMYRDRFFTTNPYDGIYCLKLETAGTWSSIAMEAMPFDSGGSVDLSGYNYMNFNYRGTKPFEIGMRCYPTADYYITDQTALSNYGVSHDGNWCTVKIPLSDFSGVDMSQILQFLIFHADPNRAVGDLHYLDNIHFSKN